jgi:hypothetical protein
MGPGRKLRKEGDVRHLLHDSLRRLLTWWDVARVTIDMLPDVALLRIFDIYTFEGELSWVWYTLVHVCRRWRSIVFGSPHRLDLQLYCRARTPVSETLDVWPLLPIAVYYYELDGWGVGNILAALERNDRICQLSLEISSPRFEELLAAIISKSAKSRQGTCKDLTRSCKAPLAYKFSTLRGLFQLNRVLVGKAIPSTTRATYEVFHCNKTT